MINIDNILQISSDAEFKKAALELFASQAERCTPYREYISLLGVNPQSVDELDKIPFLPIEIFKSHNVYCGENPPQIVFTSSNTGGTEPSKHPMADLTIYERTFRRGFEIFYGKPEEVSIYGLLPNYLSRQGSSLIYMIDNLICSGGGGFYLDNTEQLLRDMESDPRPKILLGVSYALLDLAEQYAPNLKGVTVMETGGMKGQREELPKDVFHEILCNAFGVDHIHSEYGMAELTSQAYSAGEGVFYCPPWMRIMIRDLNDPFQMVGQGVSAGVNVIDLANIYSCAFIQTQDIGVVEMDNSFKIMGRADRSEIRGCNLLIQ